MDTITAQTLKPLRTALANFEKIGRKDEGALMEWQEALMQVLEELPHFDFVSTEKDKLILRMSQCLHPETSVRVHFNVLALLEIILQKKQESSNPFDEGVVMLTASLLAFYEYASIKLKHNVLQLLREYYLPMGLHLRVCFPSLISSLLVTLEEQEEHVLIEKAETLLVDVSQIDPRVFYMGLWTAMLKCSRVKLTALQFLYSHREDAAKAFDFRADRQALQLVTMALKATLQEEDPQVVSQGQLLVNLLFPFYDRGVDRAVFGKLVMEVLLAMKSREYAVARRVREWMQLDAGGDVEDLLDLITPSVLELFDRAPSDDAETLLPIEVLEALLDFDELNDLLFDAFGLLALKHVATYEKFPHLKERFERILSDRNERVVVLWTQLFSQLEDQAMNFDLENTLILVDFMLTLSCQHSKEITYKVLTKMLSSMDEYQDAYRGKILKLKVQLLGITGSDLSAEIIPYFRSFESFMVAEMNQSLTAKDLSACFKLYEAMHKFAKYQSEDEWGEQLVSLVKSEDMSKALVTCDWICVLCPPQSPLKAELEKQWGDLAVLVLQHLWQLLPGDPTDDSVVRMVVKYLGVYAYTRDSLLKAWLRETDNTLLCLHIDRFVRVWRAAVYPPDRLLGLFSSGAGVYQCLNALQHENPVVRMHAKEWLLEVLPRLDVVMRSVFALLDPQQPFKRQLRGTRHFASMLEACSTEVLARLRGREAESALFDELIRRLFDLLQGNMSDLEHAAGSLVQFSVCRVLKQIAASGWAHVCFEISERLLPKMLQVFRQQDEVIGQELVELFLRIIFKSRLYEKPKKLKEILSCDECQLIVLRSTELQIPVWLQRLPEIVKLLICLADAKTAANTIKKVCSELIQQSHTRSTPLAAVLRVLLQLNTLKAFVDENGAHLLYSYSELRGCSNHPNSFDLFSTVSQGVVKPKEHKTFALLQLGFEQMAATISAFISKPEHPAFRRVLDVLSPYAKDFPAEVTALFINMWISLRNQELKEEEQLVTLYLALDLPWKTTLYCFDRYLREGLNLKKQSQPDLQMLQELFTCEFLYKVAVQSIVPRSSPEYWQLLLRFVKALCYSTRPEAQLWAMQLLTLADNRSSYSPLKGSDRRTVRTLQQRTLAIGKSAVLMFASEKRVVLQPPCCPNSEKVQECALLTLKHCFVPLVRLGWSLEQEQVAQLKNLVLPALASRLFDAEMKQQDQLFVELLIAINDAVPPFAYCIRANMITFLMSDGFWLRMKKANCSFASWKRLINNIAVHCYKNRESLVSEILQQLSVGIFTSKASEVQQLTRIIRCISLVLYCGDADDYQSAQSLLTERIIDWLKYEESKLSPLVFLLCRVLTLKMQVPSIAEEWPRLWPHLFIELYKFLAGKYPESHKLAAAKYLELLKRSEIEDFRYYDWAFFYTSPYVESLEKSLSGGFVPAVAKLLPERLSSLRCSEEATGQLRRLRVDFVVPPSQEAMVQAIKDLITRVLQDETTCQALDMEQVQQVVEDDLLTI